MEQYLILIIPGILAGLINSIAGGGGIIMYPAFLAAGINPLMANATSSLSVLPGSATSTYGYKKQLKRLPRAYLWMLIPCLVGSIIGSYILIHTKPTTFEVLAPWLVLSAVLLLALQSRIQTLLAKQAKRHKVRWPTIAVLCVAAFPLAVYGGYFGVGFGLMMLALLGFTNLKSIHQMNGIKNAFSVGMAIVATSYFAYAGLINWRAGLMMAIGTAIGGYFGARAAQRVPARFVHNATVFIGLIISAVLIIKQ
ncbi:MAG: sulfite exporter TauE/SafE family protein [Candidatus Saccharimonadales bacterium]